MPEAVNATPIEDQREHDRWRALSDPTRRRILDLLRAAPRTTGVIAASFPTSRIAVMKHLEVLEAAGLVTSHKRGRQRWHYVNLAPLMHLHERWSTAAAVGLSTGLMNLKRHVEERMTDQVATIDIAMETAIAAPPSVVFRAVTQEPGAWWGHPFVRADVHRLTLEATIGGHLVEHWDRGGFSMAMLTGVTEDRWIQLTGPFHLGPASVVAELDLIATEAGTTVALTFRGSGLIDPDVAAGFENAWNELIGVRLKAFVEEGTRLGIDPG